MSVPGAKRSTQAPKFDGPSAPLKRASPLVELATVMTRGTRAGELPHASAPSLPAEATTVMPRLIAALVASSIAVEAAPPRLMLTTAGNCALFVTQLTPAMTVEVGVVRPQPKTRTPWIRTDRATPVVPPPT